MKIIQITKKKVIKNVIISFFILANIKCDKRGGTQSGLTDNDGQYDDDHPHNQNQNIIDEIKDCYQEIKYNPKKKFTNEINKEKLNQELKIAKIINKNVKYANERQKYKEYLEKNEIIKLQDGKFTEINIEKLQTENNKREQLEKDTKKEMINNCRIIDYKKLSNKKLKEVYEKEKELKKKRKDELAKKYENLPNILNPFSNTLTKSKFQKGEIDKLKQMISKRSEELQLSILKKIENINKLLNEIPSKTIITKNRGYILLDEKGNLNNITSIEEFFKKIPKVNEQQPTTLEQYEQAINKLNNNIKNIDEINQKLKTIYEHGHLKSGENVYNEETGKYSVYNKNAESKEIVKDLRNIEIGNTVEGYEYTNRNKKSYLNLIYERSNLMQKILKNNMKSFATQNNAGEPYFNIVKENKTNEDNNINIYSLVNHSYDQGELMKSNEYLTNMIYLNEKKIVNQQALIYNTIMYKENFFKDNKDHTGNRLDTADIRDVLRSALYFKDSNKISYTTTDKIKEKIISDYNSTNNKASLIFPDKTNNQVTLFNQSNFITNFIQIFFTKLFNAYNTDEIKAEPKNQLLKRTFESLISIIEDLYDGPLKKYFGNINQKWKKEGYAKEQIIKDILMQDNTSGENIGHILADIINVNKDDKTKTQMLINLVLFLQKKGLELNKKSKNNNRSFESILSNDFTITKNNKKIQMITKK